MHFSIYIVCQFCSVSSIEKWYNFYWSFLYICIRRWVTPTRSEEVFSYYIQYCHCSKLQPDGDYSCTL